MASLLAVLGGVIILLSLVFRGTGFGVFLLIWAFLTAGAYAIEWRFYGDGGTKRWFATPFCLVCWLLVAAFTLLRILPH